MTERDGEEKVDWSLLPGTIMWDLAEIMHEGAKKHGKHDWVNRDPNEIFAAAMRHLWKWKKGETYDDESGKHHAAHAMANCMMLAGVDEAAQEVPETVRALPSLRRLCIECLGKFEETCNECLHCEECGHGSNCPSA